MFEMAAMRQMLSNAWPVISVLLLCSIFSGAIILERWFALAGAAFDRRDLMQKLRKALSENRKDQALAQVRGMKKPIGRILSVILETAGQPLRGVNREALERVGSREIRAEASDLARYTTGLGTIGTVAPFIGLFGTVLGIINAFKSIAENAGGGPGVVANGIAEALVTTALGLFVAIPAVVAYNIFTRKIERITEDMELCSDEVIDLSAPRV